MITKGTPAGSNTKLCYDGGEVTESPYRNMNFQMLIIYNKNMYFAKKLIRLVLLVTSIMIKKSVGDKIKNAGTGGVSVSIQSFDLFYASITAYFHTYFSSSCNIRHRIK